MMLVTGSDLGVGRCSDKSFRDDLITGLTKKLSDVEVSEIERINGGRDGN